MNRHLLNRLLLAIVVIALIVIFLPMLFSQKKKSMDTDPQKIPAMPALEKATTPTLSKQKILSTTDQQVRASALPEPLTDADQTAASHSLANVNSPGVVHDSMDDAATRLAAAQANDQAWLVRITGFAKTEGMNQAIAQLKKMNLPAYSDNLSINIGPFTKRAEALNDLNLVKEKLQLSGEIIGFDAHALNKQ